MNPLDLLALITDSGMPEASFPDYSDIGAPLMPGESAGIPTPASAPSGTQYGQRRIPIPRIPVTRPAPKPRAIGKAGVDMTNLDLGELLFLALHPSGPQLIGMMANAQSQKQDREIQRQQMEAQSQQLTRANQMQDVQTRLVMSDRGAMEVEPGVKGDFRAALSGGQKVLETPAGRFVLPTQEKQQERAYNAYLAQEDAKARNAANVAAAREAAKAKAEPKIPLAPDFVEFFKLGWARELPKSAVDAMVRQYNAVKPRETIRIISNNDGTLSVARATGDSATVETIKGGPTKAAESAGGLTPYQQTQIAHTAKKEAGSALRDAQKLIDEARAVDTTKNPPGDPRTDPEWQAAKIAVDQAVSQHPNLLEGGTDSNGYPYIKMKTGAAASPAARSARTISRADYDARVAKHGQARVDAELQRLGISVQ